MPEITISVINVDVHFIYQITTTFYRGRSTTLKAIGIEYEISQKDFNKTVEVISSLLGTVTILVGPQKYESTLFYFNQI